MKIMSGVLVFILFILGLVIGLGISYAIVHFCFPVIGWGSFILLACFIGALIGFIISWANSQ